ncbi:unnamed protein product [Vitrella brassicaformis CCMP3155]|uniref:Uncharacterized protein n=1 Tax=Vitrella brassicaformis (strain CCMP3155) TaxID=1169540 RepID=A0A0G4ER41_VITBC|nr:unnamed protein product [Vitrella brassicaformis CCMP3155]|eukprot:CEL99949.1 unnamed protein product [Vitrella brassicaformis CCMP3155]
MVVLELSAIFCAASFCGAFIWRREKARRALERRLQLLDKVVNKGFMMMRLSGTETVTDLPRCRVLTDQAIQLTKQIEALGFFCDQEERALHEKLKRVVQEVADLLVDARDGGEPQLMTQVDGEEGQDVPLDYTWPGFLADEDPDDKAMSTSTHSASSPTASTAASSSSTLPAPEDGCEILCQVDGDTGEPVTLAYVWGG